MVRMVAAPINEKYGIPNARTPRTGLKSISLVTSGASDATGEFAGSLN